ncbi:MAG: hypothetical protein ABJC61_00120 [Acidobacteriota bacterium]
MKRRLGFRPAVPHEAARFGPRCGHTSGIGAVREQDPDDVVLSGAIGPTEFRLERRLACVGQRMVHVGAVLEEEFAESPVATKRRAVQASIVAERFEGFPAGEQEANCAHAAVINAPVEERRSIRVGGRGRMPGRDVVEYQIGTSIGDSIQHR